MSEGAFKIGVLKLGCIGAAPLLDLLLDERADREDLAVKTWTCGAKLDPQSCAEPTAALLAWRPQLALLVSPNAALPGPNNTRTALAAAGIAFITLSDGPSKKAFFKKNEEGRQVLNIPAGQGFMIFPADSMIGARRDPNWGAVLLIGLGGIWVEALGDVRLLPADASADWIRSEILKLRTAKLLTGFRGAPPVDLDAVVDTALKLGRLMQTHPEITEIDINPLVVHPKGQGATALDALIVTAY